MNRHDHRRRDPWEPVKVRRHADTRIRWHEPNSLQKGLTNANSPTRDDGQLDLDLPRAGHAELPGGGQRDYFV
jgi:hypothetical protein